MDEDSFECPRCGHETFRGAHFCMRCGTRLDAPEAPPPESTASDRSNWLAADLKLSRRSESSASAPESSKESSKESNGRLTPAKPIAPPPLPQTPEAWRAKPGASLKPTPKRTTSESLSRAPAPPSNGRHEKPPVAQASRASESELTSDAIEAGFAELLAPPGAVSLPPTTPIDPLGAREVSSLFKQLASSYLSPVRDLLLELELGEARREWLDLCKPAVATLCRSSQELGDDELIKALKELLQALEKQPNNGKLVLTEQERAALEDAYAAVTKLVPEASALEIERDRREPLILQSVLRQVPGLGKLHIDRIYAAGFTKLSILCSASASELAETTGLDPELAERVVEQFAQYRKRMASIPPDQARSGERKRLEQLAATLRHQNDAYEALARAWSEEARSHKLRLRQDREETMLRVNVLLARLGEVALVEQLERFPFDRKVSVLEQFLKALEQKYERSS